MRSEPLDGEPPGLTVIPQPLQSQPPYLLLYVRRRLVAVLQVLVLGFTETCKGLGIHAAGFARKDAAASRCAGRACGDGGAAAGGGGGRGGEDHGEGAGGMRDVDMEGSRGSTHLFVSSLFGFCVRLLHPISA